MLLIVNVARNGSSLDCWLSGGKHFVVDAPERPSFYDSVCVTGQCVRTVKRLLGCGYLHQSNLYENFCRSVYDVKRFRRSSSFECDVRFVEKICIRYGFKQSLSDLNVLAFDLEMSSRGQFPDPSRDPISAIAVHGDSFRDCFVSDDERWILEEFCNVVERINPDVLVTFSGTAVDYEYPLARCRKLGISLPLGRLGDEPRVVSRRFEETVEKQTFLEGRICMDVYSETRFDALLSGVRKSLKEVSKFFWGDEAIIEVDRGRLADLSADQLREYCLNDAKLTFLLGNHYLSVLKQLAVLLNVPLDFIVYRKPSHIGNVIYGRKFHELGIVSDGSNFERHKQILFTE